MLTLLPERPRCRRPAPELEETGPLVLLGEVDLALGDVMSAEERFTRACQANVRLPMPGFCAATLRGNGTIRGKLQRCSPPPGRHVA